MLFRLIGEQTHAAIAQIVAAVVGAGFVIALQVVAILSYDTMSRLAALTSEAALAFAPSRTALWWLARAVIGDVGAVLSLLLAGGSCCSAL